MRNCWIALATILLPLPALAETVISLTFDDSFSEHREAAALLTANGLAGTFFVNSGRVGTPGFLDWADLQEMAAAGHEIGGHTVSHADLVGLDEAGQLRQICTDRVALLEKGFQVRSFAYPFNRVDEGARMAVQACGYNSGRGTSGLLPTACITGTPCTSCTTCPAAESLPAADVFHTRTLASVRSDTTLATMQAAIRAAEDAGGGWVQFVFHRICDDCGTYGIAPEVFSAFVDWLAGRGADVRRIDEVIGGPLQPGRDGPPVENPTGRSGNLLPNASLELDADVDGLPDCWQEAGTGENDGSVLLQASAHEGSLGVRIEIDAHRDGDLKLLVLQDLGGCSPPVEPDGRYVFSTWYRSDADARPIAYVRNAAGGWRWWMQGQLLEPSAGWVEANWTLPELPADAVAISVGVSLREAGWIEVDDLAFTLAPLPEENPLEEMKKPPEPPTGCTGVGIGLLGLVPFLRRRQGSIR